ncbi:MAG: hypothetical protein R3338_09305 [Thermoanaerobaculia bacterium]|nr:hypothetical protein [Thermoanaerobaculia bacterium]
MNRMIWIWRLIAILIIIVFTILMWNLYARLSRMQQQRSEPPAATEPREESTIGPLRFEWPEKTESTTRHV